MGGAVNFQQSLARGKVGESAIARWFMARGHSVLPVYEIELSHGKGPQLFRLGESFVAPDMLVFTSNGQIFVEAKHKSVFSWHRKTAQWTTGIDLRHYGEYQRVAELTGIPVWLMFLHICSTPNSNDLKYCCPSVCPIGLFGNELSYLIHNENHRSEPLDPMRPGFKGHGTSGMVYWAEQSLRRFSDYSAVAA